jgi:rod shape-determining protein MreC
MAVAVFGGLAGRVETVAAHTCQALLIAAPSTEPKMGALIRRASSVNAPSGIIKSAGDGMLSLELTNSESSVEPGDIVITGGFTVQLPRGLIIGRVVGVQYDPAFGKKVATVAPAVNPATLQEVVIIR